MAAAVLVPRLAQELTATRASAAVVRARLQKVEEAHQSAIISDVVRAALAAEYGTALAAATDRLAALEAEAAVWRAQGQPMLDAASVWLREQKELVRARQLVGELKEEPARERIDSLERELSKVQEASLVLARLTQN